jgi:propanol-preferring alcohol dehydrogenase
MTAARLYRPEPIEQRPLRFVDLDTPQPAPGELLIRVSACGICHTDLHIVEGDIPLPLLPLTPGHQIVGSVVKAGSPGARFRAGDRLGVPWLYSTCGSCGYCRSGRENLCETARFTGYHRDGGYAEMVLIHEASAFPLPPAFSDPQAAPLLCAGVIGFRALRLSETAPGATLGLYGFGASAHIVLQLARHRGMEVFVFTRSRRHLELAEQLGAAWGGSATDAPPHGVDGGIIFAPAGELVPPALRHLKRGGTLVLAGIHMSRIPPLDYSLLYEERTIRSVANSTREDVRGLLQAAQEIPLRTEVETFPHTEANEALLKLKRSEIRGSGVLIFGESVGYISPAGSTSRIT